MPSTSGLVVRGVLFLLGIASSMPYTLFITAQGYFQGRFVGMDHEEAFVNWFSTGYTITTLATMFLRTTVVRGAMPGSRKTVLATLVLITGIHAAHAAITRYPQFHGESFFRLTMLSIVLTAGANTLLQDGLMRLVATFPPPFTQSLITGQGIAGVVVAVANFVILAAHAESPATPLKVNLMMVVELRKAGNDDSAFTYFALGTGVMAISALAFALVLKFYLDVGSDDRHTSKPYMARDDPERPESRERLLDAQEDEDDHAKAAACEVTHRIRHFGATAFTVVLVTMSIFPGIASLIHSVRPSRGRFFRDLFVPALYVTVNASDLLGRTAAAWLPAPTPKRLFLASIARFLLCPCLMLCNLQNAEGEPLTSMVVFDKDMAPFVLLFVGLFSHGLLCTQALMLYPSVLVTKAEKELAASIVYFLISTGLCAGSLLSFALLAMLTRQHI